MYQAARKFPPLCSTTLNFSIKWTVPYPDVGPFSLPRLQGHSVERNLDLRIAVLETEIETLRNLPSLE